MPQKTVLAGLVALMLPAAALAADWVPGAVELSDGRTMRGQVHVPGGSIILQSDARARRYTVRVAELRRFESTIEKQSLEEEWVFRESGRDDKIFTGRRIPVRHYLAHLTFHDGRRLSGHIIAATLYVKTGDKRERFILRRKHEGKVGQPLDDLLYVRSIDFAEGAAGTLGTIEGAIQLPPGERIDKLLAINREKLFSVEGRFSPLSGQFTVGDCTEGTYDLIVVTDRGIYLYFSSELEEGAGRLEAAAIAEIQSWVDKLRDFFHTQRIVYAAGDAGRTFALVRKERHGGTTLKGAELIRRYDVWAMHKPRDQWQIEKRFFLYRLVSEEPTVTPRAIVPSPALGGHRITLDHRSAILRIVLAPNGEEPVPEAPSAEGISDGR